MQRQALMVGNSDGIGLAATRRLLTTGWNIIGISKSESPITNKNYRHRVVDISDSKYPKVLDELLSEFSLNLCIYFVGIGELIDFLDMSNEPKVIDVNFTGMVRTAAVVIPQMVKKGQGHFIGISSFADELLSAEAPSYYASKAGFSNYLRSLALALNPKGVYITNVRFGFVDTKMAKGDFKPFMMTIEKAELYFMKHFISKGSDICKYESSLFYRTQVCFILFPETYVHSNRKCSSPTSAEGIQKKR